MMGFIIPSFTVGQVYVGGFHIINGHGFTCSRAVLE